MAKCILLLFLISLAASSIIFVKTANAQMTFYNPSIVIPQFTLQMADHSYDVPPTTTTTIDQFTGKQITTTTPGYHVANKTIDFTITNQPHVSVFFPYNYGVSLYYDIRWKGHFGDIWTEVYTYDEDTNDLPIATNSSTTIISVPQNSIISIPQNYSSDAQIDFQIREVNGTIHALYPGIVSPFGYWTYETSGWSEIETLNVADGSVSITPFTNPTPYPTPAPTITPTTSPPAPTPSPAPSVPELQPLAALPLLALMLAAALIMKRRQVKKL